MKVTFSKAFAKQLGKYPAKIHKAFENRLSVFIRDPNHPQLHNHALVGEWKGYRSINISGDLRVIYEPVTKDSAFFVAFGTHSQLYR